jgi:hypothetical protein
LILIVGSAERERKDYMPPLNDPDAAIRAAELVGGALAKAGCRIAVFTAAANFIEAAVVRGFCATAARARKIGKSLIQVRAPTSVPVDFPERGNHPDLFVDMPDQHDHWIRPFLRAARDAAGVFLVGGGRSTVEMGHIALAFRLPILTLSAYGGGGMTVWQAINPGDDLPVSKECQAMGTKVLDAARAEALVALLLQQLKRRNEQLNAPSQEERWRQRRLSSRGVLGAAILLVAVLVGWQASQLDSTSSLAFLALYLMGPLGGAAAALAGSVLVDEPPRSISLTASLGFFSGFLAALVYFLAQMSTAKATFEVLPIALWFALGTGMAAGFAAERVLRDWIAGRARLPGGGKAGP